MPRSCTIATPDGLESAIESGHPRSVLKGISLDVIRLFRHHRASIRGPLTDFVGQVQDSTARGKTPSYTRV